MKITINKKIAVLFCLVIFLFLALFGVTFITQNVFSVGNHTNGTVITKVNVTNTEPRIYRLVITPDPVTLSPGNATKVTCTAYVHDWNGWQDFASGNHNATFYDIGSGLYDYATANDDNYHYSNFTCQNCTDLGDPDGTNATCNCSFDVQYFANDTTWQCNFTIVDAGGAYYWNDSRRRKSLVNWTIANTPVEPLIAINVPESINYGELAVTENSSMIQTNLTNYGNININISVKGWGGDDEIAGENLSMICRRATDGQNFANISIGYEKYSLYPWTNYSNMTNLTSNQVGIANFTLYQRINDSSEEFGHDFNATYWRIYIPLGVTGFCNGTILFVARPTPDEPVWVGY